MLNKIPSYVRDSIHFVKELPNSIPSDHYLVTYDVINLYGSIPHNLGLQAIEYWLNKHAEAIN